MADLTVTPANVLASAQAIKFTATAGAALTAGQPIYRDTADTDAFGRGKAKLADANGGSATIQTVEGITLAAAATGQPIECAALDPDFTHGLTGVAAGDCVILSATAGALCPVADLASGGRLNVVLAITSATKGVLKVTTAGAVKA
jgi:hypothetical protein